MARLPLLSLSDIYLTFGGNPLLDGLDLTVQPGDRLALVGRNGSGKSTLMKIMAGLIQPDEGERHLTAGQTVGYMEQEPDFSGFATLGEYAASGLEPGDEYRIEMVADGLKLQADLAPEKASGGERRRASLAKIVSEAPELMLLDEPTNHLDIEAIQWLENHLKNTRSAFILISHDRTFLRALTKGTLWVDRGVVRRQEKGFGAFEEWRDKVFEEEDTAKHKLNRLIKAEARWAVEGISARRTRNQGRVRRLADLREERSSQITRQGTAKMDIDAGSKSGKLVIEARDISLSFGARPIVSDFSIKIARGDRIAFVGPNGAGKTTLVKLLTGEITPDSGTVKLGTKIEMAMFDQNRSALDPNASLWDTLTGDRELGISGSNDQIMVRGRPKHVVGYLKEFLFEEAMARGPVRALSGGEKARLLLARLMAKESNLLVLDEPTNDLDVETLDLMQELLDDYNGTVLLVSHDRDFLDRVATTTIAMDGDGTARAYAGGWTDYLVQRGEVEKARKAGNTPRKNAPSSGQTKPAPTAKMTFKDEHRLKELPGVLDRLNAEIKRLEDFLADPELFTSEPEKFAKASEGLVERHQMLSDAEEEWLELEDRASGNN